MIYLAIPIVHPDAEIVKRRVNTATAIAVSLYEAGIPVFSPATHGYGFASLADRHPVHPVRSWGYWSKINLPILTRCCTLLAVIGLSGWEESVGVSAERKAAAKSGIPVFYLLDTSAGGLGDGVEKLIRAWEAQSALEQ